MLSRFRGRQEAKWDDAAIAGGWIGTLMCCLIRNNGKKTQQNNNSILAPRFYPIIGGIYSALITTGIDMTTSYMKYILMKNI